MLTFAVPRFTTEARVPRVPRVLRVTSLDSNKIKVLCLFVHVFVCLLVFLFSLFVFLPYTLDIILDDFKITAYNTSLRLGAFLQCFLETVDKFGKFGRFYLLLTK